MVKSGVCNRDRTFQVIERNDMWLLERLHRVPIFHTPLQPYTRAVLITWFILSHTLCFLLISPVTLLILISNISKLILLMDLTE